MKKNSSSILLRPFSPRLSYRAGGLLLVMDQPIELMKSFYDIPLNMLL